MAYQDKTIQCSDCGKSFTFTAREQEFYASKGFANEPKRCPECRQSRKADRGDRGDSRSSRQMYPAKCAQCGKDTEVPFQPRGDKPVYCRDCFSKMTPSR